MLSETNFWSTTVQPPVFPETPLPPSLDVAVIGAGYSGLSAARTLARAGARVAVLEAQTVGWGASSRNGGMALTGLKLGAETLVEKFGRERARRLFALSLAAIDSVERLAADERIDCAFSRTGHLEAACKPAHFNGYRRAAEFMEREFGHPARVVPRSDLGAELGSSLYFGGLLDEASASVNPAQLVMGLAEAAARAGAVMHERTRVLALERGQAGVSVVTSRGILHADKVLVATGGYTGRLTPGLERRLIPIGSYVIVTAPLSDPLARDVSPNRRLFFDSKHFLHYFRLTPDNRLLFGGRAAFTPETPASTRRSAELLRRSMVAVFPQLEPIPVEYAWGGTLDFSYDLMPHAGLFDGVRHAVGFGGHGVALATHLGDLVARQMLAQRVDNPFDDLPFPSVPFYRGNPVLHLPVAWLYYKMLDWIS